MVVYNNGTYQVKILNDGTKTRTSFDATFVPNRPETLDINLSNKCEQGCHYCYINATKDGEDVSEDSLANLFFKYKIPKHTELAFNYNSIHPVFDNFIEKHSDMLSKEYILNITINSNILTKNNVSKFNRWIESGLIKGIGISTNKYIENIQLRSKNIVFHTIVGITPISEIAKMNNNKILILGYKQLGRASQIDISKWKLSFKEIFNKLSNNGCIVSFDNLALEQLNIKELVTDHTWNRHYMGEEGTSSFYIDLITNTFSKSSTDKNVRFDCEGLEIKDMFNIIRRIK